MQARFGRKKRDRYAISLRAATTASKKSRCRVGAKDERGHADDDLGVRPSSHAGARAGTEATRRRDCRARRAPRCRDRAAPRLIREFDGRGGWCNGFRSCAEWLTWRIGLAPGAAREHVRVARALGTLPRLAEALARGELSYSKVRAITRVATPETEERLLAVGRGGTAQHVERIVRAWRAVDRKAEVRETAERHRARALHAYQDEDCMVVIRGRLEPEAGAVLMQALAAARDTLTQRRRPDVPAGTSGPTDWTAPLA